MSNNKIIIFGSSGHAKSIADILERLDYEIVGFVDSFKPVGQKVLNYKTIGDEKVLGNCLKIFGTTQVAIGIGDILNRKNVVKKLKSINPEIIFPTIISPDAYISKYSSLGEGTVVFSSSFINVECEIGRFCVINSSSILEHNTKIDSFCTISPGVNIGGDVRINGSTFIGSSATIIQKISIGNNVVIGAGAVVTSNVPDRVLMAGIPAVIKKKNYKNKDIFS
jgi:sugar O-acyltransferase (sialic acid O-acetyltransferase NeuD family)